MHAYHVSKPEDRDSILAHGLDHRRESGRNWREGVLAMRYRYPVGNYLWLDLALARGYAAGEWDIWLVDVDGLTLTEDPCRRDDSLYERACYSIEPIAPERLSLLSALELVA